MGPTVQVTIDCADPDRLAHFWAELLGYRLQDPPEGYATWEEWLRAMGIPEDKWNDASAIVDPEGRRPRIYFQRVPEPKTAKNRVHLDVSAGGGPDEPPDRRRANLEATVERALALGATPIGRFEERGEQWVTLADPEGNEFCLQ